MDIHDNARTTRHSRMLMVQRLASGWTVATVAAAQGVSPRTVRKWRDRYTAEGEAGLADRSSRPRRSPRRLAAPREAEIIALRHDRLSSPAIARRLGRPVSTIGAVLRRQRWTGKQIAAEAGVSPATVSRVLRRLGLNKLSALELEPVRRYEREEPG